VKESLQLILSNNWMKQFEKSGFFPIRLLPPSSTLMGGDSMMFGTGGSGIMISAYHKRLLGRMKTMKDKIKKGLIASKEEEKEMMSQYQKLEEVYVNENNEEYGSLLPVDKQLIVGKLSVDIGVMCYR
jgi:hypothetical protein